MMKSYQLMPDLFSEAMVAVKAMSNHNFGGSEKK
jgi:hypothetical protein